MIRTNPIASKTLILSFMLALGACASSPEPVTSTTHRETESTSGSGETRSSSVDTTSTEQPNGAESFQRTETYQQTSPGDAGVH